MTDKHDREESEEPRIRVVDRRLLDDDERQGKGQPTPAESTPAPSPAMAPTQATAVESADEPPEPSAQEVAQLRQEMEAEQFQQIEQQMGRPLTGKEKDEVRQEMVRQAESMSRLEIAPMLQQMMLEMSARAAVHMGLMPNPYTRLIARNDLQARLAIDTFDALLKLLSPHLDAASQREFQRALNDMRVNFVSVTGAPPPGEGSRIIH